MHTGIASGEESGRRGSAWVAQEPARTLRTVPNPSNCPESFELSAIGRRARTTVTDMDQPPVSPVPAAEANPPARRGPAGDDELYLDEILALTPIKRTRLYTFRDKGRFGPVRDAPGPTCARPVFQLEGVAAVCEELGFPVPTLADVLAFRSPGGDPTIGEQPEGPADRTPSPSRRSDDPVQEGDSRREPALRVVEGPSGADRGHSADVIRLRGPEPEPHRQAIQTALHEERVRQLESEHEALSAERDRARTEESAGREQVIRLEADLRITDAARERALEDLVARDARIRRLESDLEERTAEAHRLNAEHRGVQGELREAVAERDAVRGERSDLRNERDALRDDMVAVREENAALRPEIELLRANTTRGFRRRKRRQAKREAKQGVDGGAAVDASTESSSADEPV